MYFFSGFSLDDESHLLKEYLDDSEYCVAGFSYGAIKAFEYVKQSIKSSKRVDRLQLLSPAFFQTTDTKFKRLQMLSYTKDDKSYIKNFIATSFHPNKRHTLNHTQTTKEELFELLNYEWNIKELKQLAQKGINIEVYLGEKDSIINSNDAKKFFIEVATVTFVKDANHFLNIK